MAALRSARALSFQAVRAAARLTQPEEPSNPQPKAPPAPEKTAAKPAAAKQVAAAAPATRAKPAVAKGVGTSTTATAAKPRASRLGDHFLDNLGTTPTTSTAKAPSATKIDARSLASIQQAIARQIQPCADRQRNPGPGANAIVIILNLKLNEDGTLAATPRMVRQSGLDGDNDRYAQRVVDLGIAAFKGCSPLKLPAEYYSTPSGGWNNINFQWKLQ